ncbi:MAG: c-type cytochrome [Proteobacteria bacterium]|nr:c-type cytochrome [Pseudomonadota bacterium]
MTRKPTDPNRRVLRGARTGATGSVCPSCKAALQPEANFCHACGYSLTAGRGGRKTNYGLIAVLSVVAIGVIVITIAAITVERSGDRSPDRSPAPAAASPTPGNLPDLSTMSPREAADRLYNLIMAALERGDAAEATRFAPMALQAYQRAGVLGADAHYHVARIHLAVGDVEAVRRELAAIRRLVPKHLFGFTLEHALAELAGDRAGMARAYSGFADVYDAEMDATRPEYEGHRNHIEQFRVAQGRPTTGPVIAAPAAPVDPGRALFAKHCSACHGQDAVGSEKGPPLVHRLYEPGHHADDAFFRAVRQGAPAHHWSFGDMPPVPGVAEAEVKLIIAHIRGLQKASGGD